MEIETLYFLTQIIAAIAMIASLIFVGFQLRQNTEQIRIASVESYYNILSDHLSDTINNPELSELFNRGYNDADGLNTLEKNKLFNLYAKITRGYQVLHYQYKKNAFDTEFWDSAQNHLADLLLSKIYVEFWASRRHHYNGEFQELINNLISDHPKQPIFKS